MSALQQSIDATSSTMSAQPDMLAAFVHFAIPIIFFWIAMKSADKMSDELSSAGMKIGSNIGKWISSKALGGAKGLANYTGIPGGVKQAWTNRRSSLLLGSDSKRAREAREDTLAGFLAGGRTGAKNASESARNKRVSAELETLKKLGNGNQALQMLNNPRENADRKKAAALFLAEKELITSATDFQLALGAVGDDLVAAKQIVSKSPKNIISDATQFANVMQTLAANGHTRLIGDVIGKTSGAALGGNYANYSSILQTIGGPDSENGKAYNKRLTEEGRAHIRVNGTDNAAFNAVFGKMSTDDVVKQDESMLSDQNFVAYLKSRTDASKTFKKEILSSAGKKGSNNIITVWENAGISQSATVRTEQVATEGSASSENNNAEPAVRGRFQGTVGAQPRQRR